MNANCWIGHGYLWGGPWGMIMGIFFWSALIFGVFYIVYRLFNSRQSHTFHRETPLDILKKKYAKGEINSDEFEKRKNIIKS